MGTYLLKQFVNDYINGAFTKTNQVSHCKYILRFYILTPSEIISFILNSYFYWVISKDTFDTLTQIHKKQLI